MYRSRVTLRKHFSTVFCYEYSVLELSSSTSISSYSCPSVFKNDALLTTLSYGWLNGKGLTCLHATRKSVPYTHMSFSTLLIEKFICLFILKWYISGAPWKYSPIPCPVKAGTTRKPWFLAQASITVPFNNLIAVINKHFVFFINDDYRYA